MSAPFFRLPRVSWTFCICYCFFLHVHDIQPTVYDPAPKLRHIHKKKHRPEYSKKMHKTQSLAALYRNPTFPTRTTKSNKLKRRENLEFETSRYFLFDEEKVCGNQMGRWNSQRFPDINFVHNIVFLSSGFT